MDGNESRSRGDGGGRSRLTLVAAATRRGGAALLDLLLPRACVVCDAPLAAHEPGVACGRCWSRLLALPEPRCDRCGHPHTRYSCRWCPLLPPYVRAVRSFCWMPDTSAGPLVHALKYEGWTAVAEGMASRMARLSWPVDVVAERGLVVPVPLAPSRLRERGFNQSALLAHALSAHWRLSSDEDVLRRSRATQTQTRLTPEERLRNVAGAFAVAPAAAPRLRGAHVVLVDDVVTTAATLNACAAALLDGGARIISYITFGRARAAGDQPR